MTDATQMQNIRTCTIETFGEQFVCELPMLISNGEIGCHDGQGHTTVSLKINISIPSIHQLDKYFGKWNDHDIMEFFYKEMYSPELIIYKIDCADLIYKLKFIVRATKFHIIYLACPMIWSILIGEYIKARMSHSRLVTTKYCNISVVFCRRR
jgi:hypothetical protein